MNIVNTGFRGVLYRPAFSPFATGSYLLGMAAVLLAGILQLIWHGLPKVESPVLWLLDAGQHIVQVLGYPGLTAVIFLEHVFPPTPSDIILPLSGYLAAMGPLSLAGVIAATSAGSVFGSLTLYVAGRQLGEEKLRRLLRRYGRYATFEEIELDRLLAWFSRYGCVVVMVARVVPVARSLISIPAGMNRMPIGRFLVFSAIGATFWNSALIMAGYLLGHNWSEAVLWIDRYQYVLMVITIPAAGLILGYRWRQYARRSRPH